MVGMQNTLKLPQVKHILLMCVLWSYGATSEDYTRTMWVSTTGEDSPRCVHDTPPSDPIPYPQPANGSCGSLNYVLTHIRKYTLFFVGIHVASTYFMPAASVLDGSPLLNVTAIAIMGACSKVPEIQCTDGANLVFHNAETVEIKYLIVRDCGEQLQPSDSLSDPSTLYFQDCKTVRIHYIRVNITGPHGRGISFIRYNTTITHGNVFMEIVEIDHFGFQGSGIYLEVLTSRTRDASLASENIQLKNIYVNHLSSNLTMSFPAINITVMGEGKGGVISLSYINVTVHSYLDRSSRGSSISVALLDTVCHYNVTLSAVNVRTFTAVAIRQ